MVKIKTLPLRVLYIKVLYISYENEVNQPLLSSSNLSQESRFHGNFDIQY
jgi:hypothetical protein